MADDVGHTTARSGSFTYTVRNAVGVSVTGKVVVTVKAKPEHHKHHKG